MPRLRGRWRGPREEGEFPTLGYVVGEWIENFCVIPDGMHKGEPYVLTNEMLWFLVCFFRLHPLARAIEHRPSAPFVFRGGQLMRPQKWGKSPFAAAICLAHGIGPVVFDGWDADGEPVGRPHPTPWVQTVSTSEEQTDNVWLALYEMAASGPIAEHEGIDIGIGDINLPGGGKIEPRTSSGHSRLGARITFANFDESHLMMAGNGGLLLATTMKRNLGGMGGRWQETTNCYDPSQNSVAQRTQESPAKDVLIDYRPPPRRPNLNDDADCRELLRFVYGDSLWVDPDRVLADARDPAVCPTEADALRYYFNVIETGVAESVEPARWDAAARDPDLKPHDPIALGFKGGTTIALVASRLRDGKWHLLKFWEPRQERYEGEAGKRLLRAEINQQVEAAFRAYAVKMFYADSFPHWQETVDGWAGKHPKLVADVPTNVEYRLDELVRRFQAAFEGDFTHDGSDVLAAHAKAAAWARGAKRQPRPEEGTTVTQHYLKVVKKWDYRPIDAFVAGLLAEGARGHAIEKGGNTGPKRPLVAVL